MVQVRATVVSVGLRLAGDVASFGATAREALRTSLKSSLGCQEPACFLELRVQAGSISVTSILTIPEAAASSSGSVGAGPEQATPAATLAAVQAAAAALVTLPPAVISSSLGVSVTSADPNVEARANVIVPLAVAPPPPSLPPSPLPSTPPPAPPQLQPATASPPSIPSDDTQAQSARGDGGNASTMGMTMAIVGAGIGSLLLVLLAASYYYVRRRAMMLWITIVASPASFDVRRGEAPSFSGEARVV